VLAPLATTKHLIYACGLFWSLEQTEWLPVPKRRLIGTQGRDVADFYHMPGFYVLYLHGDAVYFGIARERGLGKRIHEHLLPRDRLYKKKWDSFSWFGHGKLSLGEDGIYRPPANACQKDAEPPVLHRHAVHDFEQAITLAMRLMYMKGQPGFRAGKEGVKVGWRQVARSDADSVIKKQLAKSRQGVASDVVEIPP